MSTVQTLLTKQETFDIGLEAFENEGISNITALKNQLVQSGHNQSDAINKKYEEVIARWQRLQSESNNRKARLLQVQDQFRQIEELFLTFAKKVIFCFHEIFPHFFQYFDFTNFLGFCF